LEIEVNIFNLNKKRAQKYHQEAQLLSDEGKDSEAIGLYLKAIELDPEKSETFYNLGLIYKYRNEWQLSLKYNRRANELAPDDEAARWNLAIAATALRQWDIARLAWKQNGIELEGDGGPINMNFGITPVRLNPEGDGEVVWGTRIDPVRVRIDSIPYVDSGFKYGDIVLNDGASVGYRKYGEREYSVFNVLELFESSEYETSIATVEVLKEDDLKELEQIFSTTPHDFEDWTTNIRNICRQCSEGRPHEHHDVELENEWNAQRTLGVAVYKGQRVEQLFDDWHKRTGAKLLSLKSGDVRC
jgi:tetratricopeptide (TPR) repeat protein